ncbi:twin-arginine translocase TatA/TatE family subunit [Glaciibacter flavus]|uniref:twin-arginine translocase TatA/TatE family subunit n=1 Tax=Orlajensenia flava TaxID=2565934 RepID=UPI003B00A71F
MFGLTFEKLLIIGIIAVFLLGPERLPHYAAQLGRLVRQLRDMANGAKDRMRDEMGPDFDDVDWKKLDPRQYDPRRIIREALLDDEPAAPTISRSGSAVAGAAATASVSRADTASTTGASTAASSPAASSPATSSPATAPASATTPFDTEAT